MFTKFRITLRVLCLIMNKLLLFLFKIISNSFDKNVFINKQFALLKKTQSLFILNRIFLKVGRNSLK